MSTAHLWLALAILCEVIATSALKASDGLQHGRFVVWVVAGYACAFYALGLALRTIPIGVAYAIWSGVGIVAVSLIGYVLFKQRLSGGELAGMALIAVGVVVLQVSGKP